MQFLFKNPPPYLISSLYSFVMYTSVFSSSLPVYYIKTYFTSDQTELPPSHFSLLVNNKLTWNLLLTQIGPKELKAATTAALNAILDPVRSDYASNKAWQEIEALAYPVAAAPVKKKKEKKIGTGYVKKDTTTTTESGAGESSMTPGATGAENDLTNPDGSKKKSDIESVGGKSVREAMEKLDVK